MYKKLSKKLVSLGVISSIVLSNLMPIYAKQFKYSEISSGYIVGTHMINSKRFNANAMIDAGKTIPAGSNNFIYSVTESGNNRYISELISGKSLIQDEIFGADHTKTINITKVIDENGSITEQIEQWSAVKANATIAPIYLSTDVYDTATKMLRVPEGIYEIDVDTDATILADAIGKLVQFADGEFKVIGGSSGGGMDEPADPTDLEALKNVLQRDIERAQNLLDNAVSTGKIDGSAQAAKDYQKSIDVVTAIIEKKTDNIKDWPEGLTKELVTYQDFLDIVVYMDKAETAFDNAINGTTPEGKVTITFSSSDKTYGTVEAVYGNNNEPFVSGQSIPKGSTVKFTATVNDNNNGRFDGWTVNGADKGKETTLTLTVTEATTVLGKFSDKSTTPPEDEKVAVTFNSSNETYGTVEAVYGNNLKFESGQSIPKGSTVKFTATVINNGQFNGWTVNEANKGNTNPLTLTVTEATTVLGKFSDKSTTPDIKGPSLTVTGAVYYDTSVTNAVYTGVATSVYGGTATATYASSSSPIATIDITGDYIQNFSLVGTTVDKNNNSPFSENTEYASISSLITVNENSNLGIVPTENKFDAEKVFASKRQLIVKYNVKNNPNKVVYLSIKVEEAKN